MIETKEQVLAAFQNTFLNWVADGCSYPLTDMAGKLTEFVVHGICKPEDA